MPAHRPQKYEPLYNRTRYQKQRNECIRLLGSRCWRCGAFPLLEVVARPGMKIEVPEGGRYLHSMERLERDLIPYARLLCKGCQERELLEKVGK